MAALDRAANELHGEQAQAAAAALREKVLRQRADYLANEFARIHSLIESLEVEKAGHLAAGREGWARSAQYQIDAQRRDEQLPLKTLGQ